MRLGGLQLAQAGHVGGRGLGREKDVGPSSPSAQLFSLSTIVYRTLALGPAWAKLGTEMSQDSRLRHCPQELPVQG